MASDNFNRANQNPIGAPWGAWGSFDTCRIVSNAVQNSSGTDAASGLIYTTSTALLSQWRYVSGTTDGGPAVCCQAGASSGYFLTNYDATVIYMFRVDAGGYTQIATVAGVYAAGDILAIRRVGATVIGSRNGSDILSVSDSTYLTGNPGAFFFASNLVLDDWTDGVANVSNDNYAPFYGPGMPMLTRQFFLPSRRGLNLNDTSLAATLACESTLTADLTTSSKTGRPLISGPGVSPDYLLQYRARQFSAVTPLADTSLAADMQCISSLTAALTTAIPLAATLQAQSTLTAALSTQIPLAANLQSQSTLTANLTTAIRFAASLQCVSTLTAGLSTSITLAANLQAQSTLTAALSTQIQLAAALQSVSTLTASLNGTPAALQANLACVSTLTASLTTGIALSASLASVSTFTGSLSTQIRMAAALQSVSTLTATLAGGPDDLEASLQCVSTLTAELTDAPLPVPFLFGDKRQTDGRILFYNPFTSLPAGTGLQARGDVPVARFGWADLTAQTIGYRRTGTALQLAFIARPYDYPRRSMFRDRGLTWIRNGYPVTAYLQGDFSLRFPGGAVAGEQVWVDILDGTPYSGYAPNALPSVWTVRKTTSPGETSVISSFESVRI